MADILRLEFLERREAQCRAAARAAIDPELSGEFMRYAEGYAREACELRQAIALEAPPRMAFRPSPGPGSLESAGT